MCITGAAGFQNYFPTLTATLGYSKTISLLLVAPPYVFMTFYSYVHGIMSDKFGNRFCKCSPFSSRPRLILSRVLHVSSPNQYCRISDLHVHRLIRSSILFDILVHLRICYQWNTLQLDRRSHTKTSSEKSCSICFHQFHRKFSINLDIIHVSTARCTTLSTGSWDLYCIARCCCSAWCMAAYYLAERE